MPLKRCPGRPLTLPRLLHVLSRLTGVSRTRHRPRDLNCEEVRILHVHDCGGARRVPRARV